MKKFIVFNFLIGTLILCIPSSIVEYKAEQDPKPLPVVVKDTPKRVKTKKVIYTKPIVKPEVKAYIDDIFGKEATIATAVLSHESGLRLDAKNWNCIYGDKSKICKVEDREKAWSVDCGIAQVNVKGKVCPAHLMTLEGNMKQVQKIYEEQGLEAWTSYNSGAYKQFL